MYDKAARRKTSSPRNLLPKSEGSVFSGRKMVSPKNIKESRMETTTRSWTARPILGSDFTEALTLQEVYVGVLKQRKDTSTAIQSISAVLPGFAHLKRCSNGKLLLAPLCSSDSSQVNDNDIPLDEDQLKKQLKERGFDLSLLEDKFQVKKVPAKAPRTKLQASEAAKIWPVNFHPDQTIESLIDGSIFDENCLDAIERIMLLVIEAARLEAIGDERCTGAAAVVDPEDGRILALSAARIDRHPMWHAAMLAVDLVAKLHGGGAWRLNDEGCDSTTKKQTGSSTIHEKESLGDEKTGSCATSESKNFKGRLKRIKRRYEEETPLCYPRSLTSLSFPAQTSLEMQVVRKGRRSNGAKFEKEERESDTEKCGPYLCTGYWVFLLMEPCPLCAMALLHSRVTRIFYGTANRSVGVLGTKAVLHTLSGLNHRYRVWSGILERECRQAVEEIDARRNRE